MGRAATGVPCGYSLMEGERQTRCTRCRAKEMHTEYESAISLPSLSQETALRSQLCRTLSMKSLLGNLSGMRPLTHGGSGILQEVQKVSVSKKRHSNRFTMNHPTGLQSRCRVYATARSAAARSFRRDECSGLPHSHAPIQSIAFRTQTTRKENPLSPLF